MRHASHTTYRGQLDAARQRLDNAVCGLDLTPDEARIVTWLQAWDLDTVERVTAVIAKARTASKRR